MGIYEQQLAQGKLLAMMPDHKRKVQKALSDIRQMLAVCDAPYVSLSWGKQSTCLMHLVYQVDQTIPGVFWREPETHIVADFDSVIKQFLSRWSIAYHDIMVDGEVLEASLQELGKKNHHQLWEGDNNKIGAFMGFARHESKARRYTTAKADRHNIFRRKDGFYRSTPLQLWSDMDIAAYAALHNIPMLSIYCKFGFSARTSAGLAGHAEIGFDQMTNKQRSEILELRNGTKTA